MNIGYIPLSQDLTHPADRRRIVFYANKMGHHIELDLTKKIDVLVISERANLVPFVRRNYQMPLIFDLIDGYLSPANKSFDLARGLAKSIVGQLSYNYFSFQKLVEKTCLSVDAVVCSTPEQSSKASRFNLNVHSILDSHSEIPIQPLNKRIQKDYDRVNIFWEGLPYTISGLKDFRFNQDIFFQLVTDVKFKRLLGTLWDVNTKKYIKDKIGLNEKQFNLNQWTINALVQASKLSDLALIPLDLNKNMNLYKAENRLLIMWRLGLPTLVSPSLSYRRVFNQTKSIGLCHNIADFENIFTNFKKYSNELIEQVRSGRKYLEENHIDEILLDKWNNVMDSVI